jgi:hypothetical protein
MIRGSFETEVKMDSWIAASLIVIDSHRRLIDGALKPLAGRPMGLTASPLLCGIWAVIC